MPPTERPDARLIAARRAVGPQWATTNGYSGLTAWQIVLQSQAIHPDWNAAMHLAYLADEEGVTISLLGCGDETPEDCVNRWLAENRDWPGGPTARAETSRGSR